jgi:hypothetical protein
VARPLVNCGPRPSVEGQRSAKSLTRTPLIVVNAAGPASRIVRNVRALTTWVAHLSNSAALRAHSFRARVATCRNIAVTPVTCGVGRLHAVISTDNVVLLLRVRFAYNF